MFVVGLTSSEDKQRLEERFFIVKKEETIAVFIDGNNLLFIEKAMDYKIDYKRLHEYFVARSELLRPYYYIAVRPEGETDTTRPLLDWLQYNGYTVRTKPVKTYTDSTGAVTSKGNLDVEIAVDILQAADNPRLDRIVLISGDGDFTYLVEAVQKKGLKVTVISTRKKPVASDQLVRSADEFLDLEDMRQEIENLNRKQPQAVQS